MSSRRPGRGPAPFSTAAINERASIPPQSREQILANAIAAARNATNPSLVAAQEAARSHLAKQEAETATQTAARRAALAIKVGEELSAQRAREIISTTIICENGEEEGGFWEYKDYNKFNEDLDAPKSTTTKNDLQIVKDTVHQQIFINSNIRSELGKLYNCEIIFKRNNGRYAMFITPKDTNYMINITNGISNNQERIFFNLSLKQSDKTKKIETEYISEYCVDKLDGSPLIYHKFGMEGVPPVLKKNKVDLKDLKRMQNPYLILNNLLHTKIGPGNRISISSSLDLINKQIKTITDEIGIRPGFLVPSEIEQFQYVKDAFQTEEKKTKKDAKLKIEYELFERFLPTFLRNKGVEDLDQRIPNKQLYITNNGFSEMLAFRYATYIPGFEFTKSCNGEKTFTDPLKFKLASPFTATDIYLHRFDRHFNNDYAMYRYKLDSPSKLRRLADLVELSKSLMMSFISISYDILNNVKSNEVVIKLVSICPIYQELSWNINKTAIFDKRFSTYKLIQNDKITKVIINSELLGDILGDSFNLMRAYEIPYVGTFPIEQLEESDLGMYTNKPIVPTTYDINRIEVQGVERFIMNNYEFNDEELNKIYEEFFKLERNASAEESRESDEFILDTNEFPQLDSNMHGVRALPVIPQETLSPTRAPQPAASASVPSASSAASAPTQLASAVLRTDIPLASNISSVLVDIRKIKAPIRGETRKQTGERLKKLRPVLKRLNELRQQQLEEIQILGMIMPQSIIRQTRNLEEEGILKCSRYRQNYIRLKQQVDKNKAILLKEAEEIRIKCGANKKLPPAICAKMIELHDEKRKHDLIIPISHLERLSNSGSISNDNFKKLSTELIPIKENIKKLQAELNALMETYNASIEGKRQKEEIAATRAQTREEQETTRQQTQLEEKKRIDEELIIRIDMEVADIISRGGKLNELIETKRYKLYSEKYTDESYIRAKIDSLITYAKDNIEKAIRDLRAYEYAIKDFAHVRANPATLKEDLEKTSKLFTETRNASVDSMKLFTQIEDFVQNYEGENLLQNLEILYKRPFELEKARKAMQITQDAFKKTAEEDEARRQRIIQGQKFASERLKSLEGLTEKEIKEKGEAEFKKFRIWQSQNANFIDDIKKLNDEIQVLDIELIKIKQIISDPDKFERLTPKNKTQKLDENRLLTEDIKHKQASLISKNKEYNDFLLANKTFIKTNENFRDSKYKFQLLAKIDDYENPIVFTDGPPKGLTEDEFNALQKYLKYKNKYLQLKQKI
uniref:Uncharacterized protein n=1 Tax=viral metagenome TaxID=1070528 RepID=A0A6C0HVN1_9ZZZZ